jgi:2-dehydropantoate 2-reductase
MFCVKLWDVESAGAGVRSLVGPTTAVIPLQNGIDASERLIPILAHEAAPLWQTALAEVTAMCRA